MSVAISLASGPTVDLGVFGNGDSREAEELGHCAGSPLWSTGLCGRFHKLENC